jgi:hypothetical protein
MRWKDIAEPQAASLDDIKAYAARLGVELEVGVDHRGEDTEIVIYWIKRAPRRIGSGGMVLDALCAFADRIHAIIGLGVIDEKGKDKLISYYTSYGFVLDELTYGGECTMTRFPREQ